MHKIANSASSFDTFGDLLKYLRKRAQLTQRELAIAVGYSEAHVSVWRAMNVCPTYPR